MSETYQNEDSKVCYTPRSVRACFTLFVFFPEWVCTSLPVGFLFCKADRSLLNSFDRLLKISPPVYIFMESLELHSVLKVFLYQNYHCPFSYVKEQAVRLKLLSFVSSVSLASGGACAVEIHSTWLEGNLCDCSFLWLLEYGFREEGKANFHSQ